MDSIPPGQIASAASPLAEVAAIRPKREERPVLAIGLRLLAMLSLSITFATAKLAADQGISLVETLFYRQLIALPIVFSWVALTQGAGAVRTQRIGAHISRAALGLLGMALNFGSFILLPLAEASSISFTTPLFGTILSALILKEAVGIRRWSAVLIGFLGVLIITGPTGSAGLPPFGLAVAIGASLVTAMVSIMLRALGRTEGAGSTVFWFTLLTVPALGLLMPAFAESHDAYGWGLLAIIGVAGAVAQLALTGALRWAPVSVVLPMDYSSIIWASLFGWLFYAHVPTGTTWLGAILIVASGLFIAWRERKKAGGS